MCCRTFCWRANRRPCNSPATFRWPSLSLYTRNIWAPVRQKWQSIGCPYTFWKTEWEYFWPVQPNEGRLGDSEHGRHRYRGFVIQVTPTQKSFSEIPNVLMYEEKMMSVLVEGRRPYCWLCGALGHMSKAPHPSQATVTTAIPAVVSAAEEPGGV